MKERRKQKIRTICSEIIDIDFQKLREIVKIIKSNMPCNSRNIMTYMVYIYPRMEFDDYMASTLEFRRDSSSLQSFICRYGDKHGKIKFEEKKMKTSQSLSSFIRRYGDKVGKQKFELFKENVKSHSSMEYFEKTKGKEYVSELRNKRSVTKQSFLKNHSEEEWAELCRSKSNTKENFKRRFGDDYLREWEAYKENSIMYGDDKKPNQYKYWIKQGLTKEQATQKVSERQRTFSKEICITKYGQVKGTEIWQARQDEWQQTLNSKTEEEIERMNHLKSTGRMAQFFKGNPEAKLVPGVLYYLRFFSDDIEFWKIGITSYSVHERFSPNLMKVHHGLEYEILNERDDLKFGECFKEEQRILKQFKDNRVTVNYNGFKSTECFNKDIFKGEYNESNGYFI